MGVLAEPNEGRELHASLGGSVYARHPVRTHLVTAADDAVAVVARYVDPARATTSGSWRSASGWWPSPRAAPTRSIEIRPGRLARFLERYVTRPGYGIGLGSAETMQLAIDEVGAPAHPAGRSGVGASRSPSASTASSTGSPVHRPGRSTARRATRSRRITRRRRLARRRPDERRPRDRRGARRSGRDHRCQRRRLRGARRQARASTVASCERLFADNPLGQAREQTPICLVREVPWPAGQELPAEPRRRLTPP